MHLLGLCCGEDADSERAVARLVDRLDGRVAMVRRTDDPSGRPDAAGTTTQYNLGPDGTWAAAGADRTLDDLLDDVAPDHDYAVLVGLPDADVPQVRVGDAPDPEGEVLASVPTAEDLDAAAVASALGEVDPFETLSSLVARVKSSDRAPRAGAIATFTGRVRAREGPDDDPTKYLEFERYDEVAGERMDRIERELCERDGVLEVVLHHRTGVIEYGEDIVFVVVLAGHREEAFRTVEDGINRLKDEVPLFKREVTVDEEFWVHDRA